MHNNIISASTTETQNSQSSQTPTAVRLKNKRHARRKLNDINNETRTTKPKKKKEILLTGLLQEAASLITHATKKIPWNRKGIFKPNGHKDLSKI